MVPCVQCYMSPKYNFKRYVVPVHKAKVEALALAKDPHVRTHTAGG